MTVTDDSIVLRGAETSVRIIPALGGKIASLHAGGREWLWTSDVIPYRIPDESARTDSASYVKLADTGGYDECFPTVGACTIPPAINAYGGLRLPDHGELWSQRPVIVAGRDSGGEHATATWTGRRMPYRFIRRVAVLGDGVVSMHYSATNDGAAPLPFLWSAHPLLPLTDHTRVYLPPGARVRVDAAHGLAIDTDDAARGWPTVSAGGVSVDVSHPAEVRGNYACKLFLDLPVGAVSATIEEAGARLEVQCSGVTHFGLWINNRGWTPFDGERPYRNLAFEPCIGAPDSLAKALNDWDAAGWLAPGETRKWELRWRASPA